MSADYEAMATFVAVVRAGSFRGAADALHLPRSTVSQRVARLEAQLDARLLERTTRSVRVTEVGGGYYERCARIVAEVEEANLSVTEVNAAPRGLIRIGCPLLFGHAGLANIAAAFSLKYPEVSFEIVATDRRLNIVEEGFDIGIAIFTGEEGSNFVTRKLRQGELRCYAAPSYLAKRSMPREPSDLRGYDCIVFGESREATWKFERGQERQAVRIVGRMAMSSMMMVRDAARCGAGIATLPLFLCSSDVRDGRLVTLLEDWDTRRADLRIVYPSSRHLSPRVRLFVDALVEAFPTMAIESVPVGQAGPGPAPASSSARARSKRER